MKIEPAAIRPHFVQEVREFYLTFPDFEKSYALRSQLTWSHYRLIMRLDKPQARDFYIREAADQQWSTRQLERQPDDNPTVGIILRESKEETVARYSILHGSEQLFASKYCLVLPSEEELAAALSRERKWLTQQTVNMDSGKIEGGGR